MFLSKIRDEFNRLGEESRSILISIPPELWVYFARTRKTDPVGRAFTAPYENG
jgi:hypothetical protein